MYTLDFLNLSLGVSNFSVDKAPVNCKLAQLLF